MTNTFGESGSLVAAERSAVPERISLDDLTEAPHAEAIAGPPRVVRLSLDAGESVAPHRHPESHVVVHLLDGEIDLRLDDESHAMSAGDLIRFDGETTVEPRATTDSRAVVTLAPKPDPGEV